MLEPVFITLVVIFVVYLLYQRKKRKEQQMGEELDDLIKANDWQGVSRILRKQLIIWGLLAVIATAIGIISFIQGKPRFGISLGAAFFIWRVIQLARLYRTSRDNERWLQEEAEGQQTIEEQIARSPDIHCDIVLVPPTDLSPYYKLVTMGAGAYKMNIPKELKSTICDRAEYVIFLPKDWNIIGVDNEENWWPMRMLKSAARLTVDTDDYLCITHSVLVEEDGSPVAENTQFNSFVLMPSIGKEGQVVEPLKLSLFGKKVAFYQLFPLYPEELKFKLEHGFDELVELFQEESMVVNTHRKNYCKE